MKFKRMIIPLMAGILMIGGVQLLPKNGMQDSFITANAETTEDGLIYFTSSRTVTVTSYQKGMTEVVIPSEIDGFPVTKIQDSVFKGKTDLKKVTLPGSLISLPSNTFEGCTGLETVIFEDGLTSLPPYCFKGCYNLKNVQLPDSIEELSYKVFYDCTGLKELVLPDSLTTIGFDCFMGTELESLTIGSNLEKLTYLPLDSKSLKKIKVSVKNPYYTAEGNILYSKDKEALLRIPRSMLEEMTELVIDDAVKRISFPDLGSLSTISSIHIGANLESLGNLPIDCKTLETITVSPKNQTYAEIEGFLCSKDLTCLYKMPYKAAEETTALVIPDSVTTTTYSAFNGIGEIEVLSFGGLTSLDMFDLDSEALWYFSCSKDNTNYSCIDGSLCSKDGTELIRMPAGILANSTQLEIPDSVTTVAPNALKGLGELQTVHIGSLTSLKSIDINAETLWYISCSDQNTAYSCEDGCLYDRKQTTLIKMPAALAKEAVTLKIPDTVTSISPGALDGLGELRNIHIGGLTSLDGIPYEGESVVSISAAPGNTKYAALDGILYNQDMTKLLFVPCGLAPTLKKFTLPDSVEYIDSDSNMEAMSAIEEITIGAGLSANDWDELPVLNKKLRAIYVSEKSQNYSDIDGVLYDKKQKWLYMIPPAMAWEMTKLEIPDSVERTLAYDIMECLDPEKLEIISIGANLSGADVIETIVRYATNLSALRRFEVSPDNQDVTAVDGVLYSKDMKTLFMIPRNTSLTKLTLPDELTRFHDGTQLNYINAIPVKPMTFYAKYGTYGYSFLHKNASKIGSSFTGDLDDNGATSVSDIVILYKYLHRLGTMSEAQMKAADMNLDGSVDVFDLTYMRHALLREHLEPVYTMSPEDPIKDSVSEVRVNNTLTLRGPTPPTGYATYFWSFEDENVIYQNSSPKNSTFKFTPLTAGTVTVRLDYTWYPSWYTDNGIRTVYLYPVNVIDPSSGNTGGGTGDGSNIPDKQYTSQSVSASTIAGALDTQYSWSCSNPDVSIASPTSRSTMVTGVKGTSATLYVYITAKVAGSNGRTQITTKTEFYTVYF